MLSYTASICILTVTARSFFGSTARASPANLSAFGYFSRGTPSADITANANSLAAFANSAFAAALC